MSLLLLALVACEPLPVDEPEGEPGPCALLDEQNYRYDPTLSAPVEPVAPFEDVTVSWAGLTEDLLGHPVDPASLDQALLLAIPSLDEAEVLDALASDQLLQSQVEVVLTCSPVDASCRLSDFGILGNQVDVQQYLAPDSGSWLVIPGRAGELAAASLLFLDPQEEQAPVGTVAVDDGDAWLAAEVDLHSAPHVLVEAGDVPVLDWSGLTRDALGNPITLSRLDRLLVGRFDQAPHELEEQFLDLLTMPADRWQVDVAGQVTHDLALLDGFEGFSQEGSWLVALMCSTCASPAPRFLAMVEAGP